MQKSRKNIPSIKGICESLEQLTQLFNEIQTQLNVLVAKSNKRVKKAKYYNSYEVCRMMNISSSTLYRWRNAQKIKFKQVGKRYFYPCSEVDALL